MEKFEAYVKLIDEHLTQLNFDKKPKELYTPISYILSLGGKKLRPALSLAACELFSGNPKQAIGPALGVELFHNFSLMHDDIMDEADLRRGKQTVHKKWNSNVAILSGDAMLVKAYQYTAQVASNILPQVIGSFSQVAIEICEGQQMDMNFETQEDVSEENYLEMIRLKTAVLLGYALKVGALVAGAENKKAERLSDYGVNAGMAFQIQDDILDAFGDQQKVGKVQGGDILQDKKTLLMIYAKNLDSKGFEGLKNRKLTGVEKINAYKSFFKSSGAYDRVVEKREQFLKAALVSLEAANGENKGLLGQLKNFAVFLAHREN